jgi:hypothetical protein
MNKRLLVKCYGGAKKNEQETKDGNDSAAGDHSHSQTDDKDAGLDREQEVELR